KMHLESQGEIFEYDVPFFLINESRETVPKNILDHFGENSIGNPAISKVFNNRFRHNGMLWAKGVLEINGSHTTDDATILKGEKETFGWLNHMIYSDFPEGHVAEGTTNRVDFSNAGDLALLENNESRNIYFMATFNNNIDGNGNQRALICRKDQNSAKLEVDAVSILPNSINISESSYPSFKTIAFSESEVFGIFADFTNDLIEVYYGNMSDGFKLQESLTNVEFSGITKGLNEFFIVCRNSNDRRPRAYKFSKNAQLTDLGDVGYGKFSHLNGHLIVGSKNDLNQIEIVEITDNGEKKILANGNDINHATNDILTFKGDELMGFASDGNTLYAAIKNGISPVYKGRENQFIGIEIIKYKN
ncbi:MAG: hypothetical protein ACPGLV_11360, partial [Bacteroidia bacterium]